MSDEEMGVLETVRDLRGRDPFVPFRITMTSGQGYVVENSELLAIGKSQLVYCLPKSDRIAHLRLNQIATAEELEGKTNRRKK